MARFSTIRARLFLKQLRGGFLLMLVWFAFGTWAYTFFTKLPPRDALLNALYLGRDRGWFWDLYSFWGQCVLFGIVVTVFVLQSAQRYNPEEGCRMLAREMTGHTIIVGHTHFGARLVEHLRQGEKPYVLIDKNPMAVDHLVRLGEPVIVDNAKEDSTLEDAGVVRAHLLVVAADNVETALLVTKRSRERNPTLRIVVRCFQDDFAEILEGLGANEVISSSKTAFKELLSHLGESVSPPPAGGPGPAPGKPAR